MATIIGIGIGCSKRKISGSSHIKETTRFYILPLENTEITTKQLGRLYTDGAVQYSFDDTTWHEFEFETKINSINVSDFYSNNLVYVRWTKQFYEQLLMNRYEAFYLQSEMDRNTVSELILIKQDDEYVWFVGDYGTIVDDPMMGIFMFAGSRSGNIRKLGNFRVDCMMLEAEGSTVLCEDHGNMIEQAQFTHDYDNETVIISQESSIPVKVSSGQKLYLKHSDDKIIDGGNSLKINLDCFYEIGGDLLELSGQSKETFNFYSYFENTNKLQSCGDLLLPETLNYNKINGYFQSMFQGCTSLVNAPALPATTLAGGCYDYMFQGCTSLVNAPALPVTTLADGGYDYMFRGCSNLKEIYCNARYSSGTTEITSAIGYGWLSGVPNTTDCKFHKNPDWSGPTTRGNNTIPSNWQIVNWTQDTM